MTKTHSICCGYCHADLADDADGWRDHFARSHPLAAEGYWFVLVDDGTTFKEAPYYGDGVVNRDEIGRPLAGAEVTPGE